MGLLLVTLGYWGVLRGTGWFWGCTEVPWGFTRGTGGTWGSNIHSYSYFYSTTKQELIQIKNHNLLSSLDPPNQRLVVLIGRPIISEYEL